jgi:hypothetical protein
MNKTTILSIAGLVLIATLLIGCGTLGLAVRTGVVGEQVLWFPPGTRYQVIVRIGNDAPPWSNQPNRPTAINLWVHGRGTDWHYVNIVRVPLGKPVEQRRT